MDWFAGSLALKEAVNNMSRFVGALGICFASGSNSNINRKLRGNHFGSRSNFSNHSTQVKHISSVRHAVPGFCWKSEHRTGPVNPVVFAKISSVALKQMCREAERLQSHPLISIAAALVQPFCNVISNVLALPLESSSVEAERCMDQRSQGCGPCSELYLQSSALANTMELRTGVEFPSILDDIMSGERNSRFIPEVLVGTGSRSVTIFRIKTLSVYAFGFYVDPYDVCEKLGSKYAYILDNELNKRQDFYQDLLREDINMTIRLVVNCNGIKINTVKDAFENSLRGRVEKTNPDADLSCIETFGSMFSQDMPINMGTTINFRRTADGDLITEVDGNHIGAVQSKDLCRAFFDMYIGDLPVCEQTKEEIGKNVLNIIKMC
ncbi:Chalcone isomerase [Handroanthus impetiginosus]|uniref:Chalcone isomerase n=1 Tax=Handroanthus impetiginosus TaxID=429701 RepID=A0A2G9HVQ5_9LAMI|nr:Chalcone isomerase [Handroanthus impetiginosus]